MGFAAPLRQLLAHVGEYRTRVVLASCCSVINKVFDLAPPILIGLAIDVVVKRSNSWLASVGVESVMMQLVWLGAATFVVWAAESAFEYAYGVLWRGIAQDVQHDARVAAFSHLQTLDMSFFDGSQSGDLVATMNDDINQLERFLDGGANDLWQVATTVIIVGSVFLGVSWQVAIFAFAPIPLILWGSFAFQRRVAEPYQVVRDRAADVNAMLAGSLLGVETTKSYTAEARQTDSLVSRSDRYRAANAKAIRLSSAFSPLIRMAVVIGFLGTLLWGGHLTLVGELAVGTYGVLVFVTQRLLWPLTRLGSTFDLYQRAMASTRRVLRLFDERPKIVGGTESFDASDAAGALTFDAVSFAFDEREPLFVDLSLSFPPQQTTAIVGPTGAGKSSVLKLIQRFYEHHAGRIAIDGTELSSFTLESLRENIAYVPQDVFLMDGTLRENILWGAPDASTEAFTAAVEAAEVRAFAAVLPDGLDTRVGERGVRLSGGQRQRVAFARALVKDAPILLLDEATSAVDNQTELAMQRALKRVRATRTVIVVAHRLSTIKDADRILVIDDGRLAESGQHDALLARGGLYERLWNAQQS